jgi:hypothetical protein
MAQSIALESLISKREQLLSEMKAMEDRFKAEISELDTAIELLSGKTVWQIQSESLYNDEHPDYIKSSQEEM